MVRRILLSFISLFFMPATLALAEDSVTITTYYPSPYGVYNKMATNKLAVGYLNNAEQPARDGDIRLKPQAPSGVGQEGEVTYSTDDYLYVYNGSNWIKQGGVSYAVIVDEEPAGTDEVSTALAWNTRALNTEISDPNNIVSIAANRFTLQAGNYLIEASAPMFYAGRHRIRLQNITNGTTVAMGTSSYSNDIYDRIQILGFCCR